MSDTSSSVNEVREWVGIHKVIVLAMTISDCPMIKVFSIAEIH